MIKMNYARCIQNKGNEASLTVGVIYRVLPTTELEKNTGMLRIVDNEGEDYLYPSRWFEMIQEQELVADLSQCVAVHLSVRSKIAIRDIARARGVPMSALLREWIDERLDMPEALELV